MEPEIAKDFKQAKKLLREIKQRPNGTDVSERFLQKTIPDVLTNDITSPGIKRAKTTWIAVLDEEALKGFFTSQDQIQRDSQSITSRKKIQQYVKQHLEIKQYSKPVGINSAQPSGATLQ